jgi:hypothetical protein
MGWKIAPAVALKARGLAFKIENALIPEVLEDKESLWLLKTATGIVSL